MRTTYIMLVKNLFLEPIECQIVNYINEKQGFWSVIFLKKFLFQKILEKYDKLAILQRVSIEASTIFSI